jgi:hypothetical protein
MAMVVPPALKLRALRGPAVADVSAIANEPYLAAMKELYIGMRSFDQLLFAEQMERQTSTRRRG